MNRRWNLGISTSDTRKHLVACWDDAYTLIRVIGDQKSSTLLSFERKLLTSTSQRFYYYFLMCPKEQSRWNRVKTNFRHRLRWWIDVPDTACFVRVCKFEKTTELVVIIEQPKLLQTVAKSIVGNLRLYQFVLMRATRNRPHFWSENLGKEVF